MDGIPEVAARVFQISVSSHPDEHTDVSDLVITLEKLVGFNILDLTRADEMHDIGYQYVKELDLSVFTS